MLTLSAASLETKQIIKWVIIFIIAIISIFALIKITLIIKDMFFPSKPAIPTMAFGKLPAQVFPVSVVDKKFSYSLNTVSGGLPALPQQTKVYRIQKNVPDLLAVNKFDEKIKNIGFTKGYTTVTDKVFQWNYSGRSGEISKTVNANILTGDFTITSAFLTDPDVISGRNLRKERDAIEQAKNILSSMQLLSKDLDLENIKTNLYSILNGALVPATSISQAHIIEVYFPQKDINKLHIFYEKPNSSNINIYIAGGSRPQLVAARYVNHTATDEYATYSLKSTMQAFTELQQGNGYIASYTGTSNNIAINDVTLAYYMTSQIQDFIMPVFVFTGNDDFYAYVPAIMDESISK